MSPVWSPSMWLFVSIRCQSSPLLWHLSEPLVIKTLMSDSVICWEPAGHRVLIKTLLFSGFPELIRRECSNRAILSQESLGHFFRVHETEEGSVCVGECSPSSIHYLVTWVCPLCTRTGYQIHASDMWQIPTCPEWKFPGIPGHRAQGFRVWIEKWSLFCSVWKAHYGI